MIKIDQDGTIKHFNDAGELHRLDGPAIIKANGDYIWMLNNVPHRDSGGPAVKRKEARGIYKVYYRHGKVHRDDGPAVIKPNGIRVWYTDGKRNRLDGPAYTDSAINVRNYWIKGTRYPRKEFKEIVASLSE
tara:strand:- start:1927 stop:2322 length:396 start_codon:yes stop_codon:yes gene_type:complete